MTQRLFITLGSRARKDRVLLEMPGDQPIREMIRDLAQVVDWKELAEIPVSTLCLETEEGERLAENQSLSDAGVSSSDLLFLASKEITATSASQGTDSGAPANPEPTAAQSAASEHVQDILRQPRLAGPRGLVFLLEKPRLIVGRAGKGWLPDIDLAEWDPKMIASRKHAVIEQTKDGFVLRPEKATNSTFVNGVEVPAGELRILKEGDRIQFGFQGLELVFSAAKS